MKRPPATIGMRHLALNIILLEECEHFYVDLLGMRVEWRPDKDNLYLTSGNDNLALHRVDQLDGQCEVQHLDHMGFFLAGIDDVDRWHEFMVANDVPIKKAPWTHRDGARSFYCNDPDGNTVQLIFHPPITS